MTDSRRPSRPRHATVIAIAGLVVGAVALPHGASAQPSFEVLHTFVAAGISPRTGLVPDAEGNLHGTAIYGGLYDHGNVFKIDAAGAMTILHSFTFTDGRWPTALTRARDGSLWGATVSGGTPPYPAPQYQYGTVFKIDAAGAFTVVHTFESSTGANGLVEATDGSFYGTGGSCVFRIDVAGVRGPDTCLGYPINRGLIQARDGDFYGTTLSGGANGLGTVFRMDGAGNVTTLHSFNSSTGPAEAGLIQASDDWLYGSAGPVVFKINSAGAFAVVHTFNTATEGHSPRAPLFQASDGSFYGTTCCGGPGAGGAVFKMDSNGMVTVLHSFAACCSDPDGNSVIAPLTEASDGYLYGTASDGGINRSGTLFRISPAGTYETVHSFGVEPHQPRVGLIEANDGRLYGTAWAGGSSQFGAVFRMEDSGSLTVFSVANHPSGSLLQGEDLMFYGTLEAAPGSLWGGCAGLTCTVFEMDSSGAIIKLGFGFHNPYQLSTYFTLMQATDGTFYGTSYSGTFGDCFHGCVFTVDSFFNQSSILHTFDPSVDGAKPLAPLIQGHDGSWYGTNSSSSNGHGTVFRLDGAGATTVLHWFNGPDGSHPQAPLIQTGDGSFYGTTVDGGASGLGTVFKIDPSGVFSVRHSFSGAGGANPQAGLVLATDGAFYGTTRAGGAAGAGTVFRMDGAGAVTVVHSFTASTDGAAPVAGLIQASDGALYGTASHSGPGAGGTIFRLTGLGSGQADTTPPVLTLPADITIEAGGLSGIVVVFAAAAVDAVDGPTAVTCSMLSGATFPMGSTTVTCSASDTHGNTATGTFTVTVQDTTPPVLALPEDITAEASTPAGAVVSYGASATDLVDGAVAVSCAPASGATFPMGSTTVTCSASDTHGNTTTGTFAVTVQDTTPPPDPTIISGPVSPTRQTSATFEFGGGEAGAVTLCDLDGGGFAVCDSPQEYAGPLPTGPHVFSVKAQDAAGNESGTVSFAWTMDTAPPDTVLDSIPMDPSSSTGATFTFHATEADSTLECSLDGAAFAACTSPATYTDLADGSHTFQARATDAAGNIAPSPTSFSWTIDATAPDTMIDSAPASLTSSNNPTFTFHASEASTFECSLDGGAFTACASGVSYGGLAEGSHTFEVRAIDAAGNPDSAPASFAWTIDTLAPPTPAITSAPANPTNQTSASFSFTDDEVGLSVLCQLDGGLPVACSSPVSYPGPLSQGGHTFSVWAQDAAGNQSGSATFSWTVDTTAPPKPTITSTPASATTQTSATFSFTAGEAEVSFLCKLDVGGYSACSSPAIYPGPLDQGSHTFSVRAQDAAGNQSGATSFSWTIDTTAPPPPTITAKPASLTNQTSATFGFTDGEAGVSFLCQRDESAFGPCTSPTTYSGLGQGGHTFSVKARDAAGNEGGITGFSWTIDTTAPLPPTVTGTPANPTNQTSASFSFTGEAGESFLCQRDGSAFSACTSPATYSNLKQGAHSFAVKAQDAAGNQSSMTSFGWTVDTAAPPTPTITARPANPTTQMDASFSFSDGEAGVSFLCQLDGSGYSACSSGVPYAGLSESGHTFSVKAQDAAGNQSAAASFSWTIDRTPPPTPTITSTPATSTKQTSATFKFTDGEGGVSFLCQLDGSAPNACTSPQKYTGLSQGSHSFTVTAQDGAGNQSGPTPDFTWTITP